MAFEVSSPTIRVEVEGQDIGFAATKAIIRCEVDLSRDLADQIKLLVANPFSDDPYSGGPGEFAFIDSAAFEPGNRVDVYLGYANENEHVCSGIIAKWLPKFSGSGFPTLEIIARDASIRMMDGETSSEARVFGSEGGSITFSDIVRNILDSHDILPGKFDETPERDGKVVKKAGMTDYQFVKGIANLHGFEFHVVWNTILNTWDGNFRFPVSDQTETYDFVFGDGSARLLNFEPQWGLQNSPSAVKILYYDRETGTWEELIEEGTKEGKSPKFTGGNSITQPADSLSKLRVAADGKSVEIVGTRQFYNAEDAKRYAENWFAKRIRNFITARGKVIGLPGLRPGDVHNILNIGTRMSGEWEFTNVRHVFTAQDGFVTNFAANKVITS